MADKQPQSTVTLMKRLRRVAKWLDTESQRSYLGHSERAAIKARANTCWQAAARLDEHLEYGVSPEWGDKEPDASRP